MKWQSTYFLLLSGAGFMAMAFLGFKSVLAEKPQVQFPQCFLSSRRPYARLLPEKLDPYVCATYEAVQQLSQFPAADLLITQLIRFGVTFVGIVTFEGGRQSSFWLKQSDLYLFVAQATSGAAAIPAYFATIQTYSLRPPSPSPEDAWASFVGTLVGFLGPIVYGSRTDWRDNALNIFLLYPVLVWAVRQSVRSVLRPLVQKQSYRLPMLLQALVGIMVSAGDQFALYRNYTFDQLFRPNLGIHLVHDLHAMLLADFAITATALVSHVVLYSYKNESLSMKLAVTVGTILLSTVLGPGGAISVAWICGEFRADKRSATESTTADHRKLE